MFRFVGNLFRLGLVLAAVTDDDDDDDETVTDDDNDDVIASWGHRHREKAPSSVKRSCQMR